MSRTKNKKPTGTREWASENYNIQTGCEHDCRYCYARYNAVNRFHRVKDVNAWKVPVLNWKKIEAPIKKVAGTIMFPTTHDITPVNDGPCFGVLLKMVQAGNNVLIVTKPHADIVRKFCNGLEPWKDQVLWRFTIGSANTATLRFWEPGAPTFEERMIALETAALMGYKTSVSMEPYLDGNVKVLVDLIDKWVNDAIWIGPMNEIKTRVNTIGWDKDALQYLDVVRLLTTRESIIAIYKSLKDHPKVKWKNAVKAVVGLPTPKEIGMDE